MNFGFCQGGCFKIYPRTAAMIVLNNYIPAKGNFAINIPDPPA